MSLLVSGSIGLDSVTTPAGSIEEGLGGSASYAASSASFFCNQVRLAAAAGSDFPRSHIDFFKKRGIDLEGLIIKEGRTFRWQASYNDACSAAQTLRTELNVLAEPLPDLPAEYRKSQFVFLANDSPQNQLSILEQLDNPELVAADTMNLWIENENKALASLINRINLLFINDAESRMLTGESNLLKAARWILNKGPRMVIIKKGEHGALLFSKDKLFISPAYLLEEIKDPTGAGDSFAGGFMGYLAGASQLDFSAISQAVLYGNIIASFVVEDFSLRGLESLTHHDIENRVAELRRLVRV